VSPELLWDSVASPEHLFKRGSPSTLGRGRALTNNKPKYILATTQQLCVEAKSVFVLKEGALH
jgi:hypothetical protein